MATAEACSTPCGVTAICTQILGVVHVLVDHVLNALRRHCDLHTTPGLNSRT